MNGYVPKVGDKVKATCGDLVLAGRVECVADAAIHLDPELDSAETYACWRDDPWHFEQVVSVPTKFGAVIRRADGLISFLGDTFEEEGNRWWHPMLGWCTEAHATAGGFTVLFEGVDE